MVPLNDGGRYRRVVHLAVCVAIGSFLQSSPVARSGSDVRAADTRIDPSQPRPAAPLTSATGITAPGPDGPTRRRPRRNSAPPDRRWWAARSPPSPSPHCGTPIGNGPPGRARRQDRSGRLRATISAAGLTAPELRTVENELGLTHAGLVKRRILLATPHVAPRTLTVVDEVAQRRRQEKLRKDAATLASLIARSETPA